MTQQGDTQTGQLLTASDIADETGLTVSTINRDAQRGLLQAARKGFGRTGRREFTREAVDAYKRMRQLVPAP